MKINRIPTTLILSALSWIIAISGLLGYGYLIIYKNEMKYLVLAPLMLLGSLLLAALVRMFGNIGQMIFDLRVDIQQTKDILNRGFVGLSQDIKKQLQDQTTSIIENLQ
ncbi:MAG: hypothetical protein NC820_05785, partial [Candidatus Omnitrophica bacterium]|nr:hypothetical protein [Candidatus Omnitrophota bacterium]